MYFLIEAGDEDTGSLVEAAVDDFEIIIKPAPAPTSACDVPAWNNNQNYTLGDNVSYDGKRWQVIHSNADAGWGPPDSPELWAVWDDIGDC